MKINLPPCKNVFIIVYLSHWAGPVFWPVGGELEFNRCSFKCSAAEITICVTERLLLCVLL